MQTITPIDLRRSLGRILDEASAGKRFLIERDRRPLAVLVSVGDAARLSEDPDEAQRRRLAAIEDLEDWRRRVAEGRSPGQHGESAAQRVRANRDERDARDRQRASGTPTGRRGASDSRC